MSSDSIDCVEISYGNGTLYVTDRNRVRAFEEYNFDVESLRPKSRGEYWVTDEMIVASGATYGGSEPSKLCGMLRKVLNLKWQRRGATNKRASF
jgi:hypothetical protein